MYVLFHSLQISDSFGLFDPQCSLYHSAVPGPGAYNTLLGGECSILKLRKGTTEIFLKNIGLLLFGFFLVYRALHSVDNKFYNSFSISSRRYPCPMLEPPQLFRQTVALLWAPPKWPSVSPYLQAIVKTSDSCISDIIFLVIAHSLCP